MKICHKCGERNFFSPGDDIKCGSCGLKLDSDGLKKQVRFERQGLTKKSLTSDEYPWDDEDLRSHKY